MKHLAMLEMTKRAVRSRICTQCYQRPHGSEKLEASVPRECEPQCTIFMNLSRIAAAVFARATENRSGDDVMRTLVCSECSACPSAGDFCSERLARTCPLSRYNSQLLTILEQLRDHHPDEAAAFRHAYAAIAPAPCKG